MVQSMKASFHICLYGRCKTCHAKEIKAPRRILALLLAISVLFSASGLSACGGQKPRATTMHLAKAEGSVGVADDDGASIEPAEQLGLYDGYQVATRSESYAWIDLDRVKLTKMDAESRIEIQKDGKDLEILVQSGGLFFNVTEPLAEDETMNIRTSNMMVGIRGTCGWVQVSDQNHMQVSLLEGTVTCTVFDLMGRTLASETISAGETASMVYDTDGEGSIQTGELRLSDIPPYVLEEVENTDISDIRDMLETLRRNAENPDSEVSPTDPDGTEPRENPDEASGEDRRRLAAFLDILNTLSPDEAMYARLGDLNGDGIEDLLTLGKYTYPQVEGCCFIGYIWNGEGADRIPFDRTEFMNVFGYSNFSVYREKATGTLYVRYLFHQDTVITYAFENAVDHFTREYSYDYEAPTAAEERDRIMAEIQEQTEERFELLETLNIFEDRDALRNGVEDLKNRLSVEITADTGETASGEQDGTPGQEALPADISSSQFVFASGAGAWATILTLHPDGSFEGEYYDSNQGESGNGYEATLYTCVFRGQMENIQKTDDNTWSMTVSGISTQVTPGQEWIEDKVLHVATNPNGLAEGDSVCLYAPETLLGELPEESLIWKITDREDLSRPLGAYAFYNLTQETAFFQ